MAHVPPPPYPAQGKNPPSITIGGKKIYINGPSGYDHFKASDFPVSALTKMARWEIVAKAGDPDKYSDFATTECKKWIAGDHSEDNARAIAVIYSKVVGNLPSASPVPGSGAGHQAISGITSVVDFLNKLTDPHLWVRILEVLIGAALVGIGAAHMSDAAKSALKATPLGKVL